VEAGESRERTGRPRSKKEVIEKSWKKTGDKPGSILKRKNSSYWQRETEKKTRKSKPASKEKKKKSNLNLGGGKIGHPKLGTRMKSRKKYQN